MSAIDDLLVQQEHIMNKICRALPNFKKLGQANWTAAVITQRLVWLETAFAKCEDLDIQIHRLATEVHRATINYFVANLFAQTEDTFQDSAGFMANALSAVEPLPAASASAHSPTTIIKPNSHLPRIDMPSFDGAPLDWESFRDRFRALIHKDPSLSTVEKLHYLMSSLKNEALRAVSHLTLTDDNYEVAWKVLMSRYENTKLLINKHLSTLFTLPSLQHENAQELRALLDAASVSVQALRNLDRPVHHWDDILVYLIVHKLDSCTRRAWELHQKGSEDYPSFTELSRFIDLHIRALEAIHADLTPQGVSTRVQSRSVPRPKVMPVHVAASTTNPLPGSSRGGRPAQRNCPLCKQNHPLFLCAEFLSIPPSQRFDHVKTHHRCCNCLAGDHLTTQCSSRHRCRVCFHKHHTLLHSAVIESDSTPTREPPEATALTTTIPALTSSTQSSFLPDSGSVLLATAFVKVSTPEGRHATVRALIDQGSTATFMSENLAQLLKVTRQACSMQVAGINGAQSHARHFSTISLNSLARPQFVCSVKAVILSSLTRYQPARIHGSSFWNHTRHLQLADNDPTSAEPIDLILGADIYSSIIRNGTRRGRWHHPIAQNTVFGWILSGRVAAPDPADECVSHSVTTTDTLAHDLHQFWEVESVPTHRLLSPEDQACEEHFTLTHSRTSRGRYIVRLPFIKDRPIDIGPSFARAKQQLLKLERRLHSDPVQSIAYASFMNEYESLNHMEPLDSGIIAAPYTPYFIPHHAVLRTSNSSAKLRVVFNASSTTVSGHSLNDYLAIGAKLQVDLSAVILRWRQFQFVVSADIEKMYRQILVHHDDQDYQRILWRRSPIEPIQEYRLKTVTYGTRAAPFLALRVLRQLSSDEGSPFPLAVAILQDQTYVDDCLFGSSSRQGAINARNQLVSLLQKGGFHLHKWASNCRSILHGIDPQYHGLPQDKDLSPSEALQVLGVAWRPDSDQLCFPLRLTGSAGTTKREILSVIARLYDPLGWITPVIITAKILIQQLWLCKCDWDDALPTHIKTSWDRYYQDLHALSQLRVSRWTGFTDHLAAHEVHAFADASTQAYAAAIYLKCIPVNGPASVSLLIAKSKVAPVKTLSVPRLELCAALLSSKLLDFTISNLRLNPTATYCWTDSQVVLAWLRHSPTRWHTFVANRVAVIQELTTFATWHHVDTHLNPADCASRGLLASELAGHSLWWSGPAWLSLPHDQWPLIHQRSPHLDTSLEQRVVFSAHVTHTPAHWDLQDRFSSWPRLLRVTALLMRFIRRLKRNRDLPVHRPTESLTPDTTCPIVDELQAAKRYWLGVIQRESFPQELAALLHHRAISPRSPLASLIPFIDSDGILRAQGRLRNARLALHTRRPIILGAHRLTDLLIHHHHHRTLHGGPQLTTASLRQEYWIVRSRHLVRSILHHCVPCTRERARTPNELMGELPNVRVNRSARAFYHTGVDYAGPIAVRSSPGRGHKSSKAYIALFICMTVKAIHLEVVSDYSSAAFLAAYQRFVARRGVPSTIHSDNGTTFHGADRELRSTFARATTSSGVRHHVTDAGTKWHFLPPLAPHFGGLWEAGIKSVKHHLRRCIGNHTLTFEELTTFLSRVEACLNSRPLAALSDTIDDYNALTPGHFLIGAPLLSPPEPSILHLNEQRLSRWQLVQRTAQNFWKAWSSDYVQGLQQRPKWRIRQQLARVGQLVLLRNDNAPPSQWELGRITSCHPGPDGLTRVVTVRTGKSEYERPITKLCYLPIVQNEAAEHEPATADDAVSTKTRSLPA